MLAEGLSPVIFKRNKPTNQPAQNPPEVPSGQFKSSGQFSSVPQPAQELWGTRADYLETQKKVKCPRTRRQQHSDTSHLQGFLCKPHQFAKCQSPGALWMVWGGEMSLSGAIKYRDVAALKPSGKLSSQEILGSPPYSSWRVGNLWPLQFSPPQSFLSQATQSSFTDINKPLIYSLCFSLNFFVSVDISTLENLKTLAAIPLSS